MKYQLWFFFVGLNLVGLPGWAAPVPTDDRSDQKIALLSAALLARDAGDFAAARKNLETLLAWQPDDTTVKTLLAGLDKTAGKAVQVSGGVEVKGVDEAEALWQAELARREKPAEIVQAGIQPAAPVAAEKVPDTKLPEDIRGSMLAAVKTAWQRPTEISDQPVVKMVATGGDTMQARLDRIVFPEVNFSGMELSRVIATLGVLSRDYDQAGGGAGVNLVLLDQSAGNPPVTLTLREVTLRRLLDLLMVVVGYRYDVQADAVLVRPSQSVTAVETEFFPVSRSTVLRMTGRSPEAKEGNSPVAPDTRSEGVAIRSFLQLAGVPFDEVTGSALAFDGSQLIVTQTPRHLDRVGNILRRYSAVRQVEIEAKFMEVQQGALEELGVQWDAATKASQVNAGVRASYQTGSGVNRSLADAFRNATTSQQITVTGAGQADGLSLPAAAPTIPGGVLLGSGAGPLANVRGVVGEFDVNAIVRALSQQSGTELLSAPKLTVLSGNQATITVAQEMRYPQSYGQIQSQVGTGSVSGGGSAGVSITSGTPQEFTSRNVGVELKVTPTVEEDDRSVSLDLNPKVTEFEGFVEYGGPSIAISGGTTVTVPPGFYQPIFAVREVTTRVTIWDGATLMMGGLTREEVKKVSDKVPVLGSIPIIGRLFQSKGESSQKRNLLIFVTANLVTPGGGLSNAARRTETELRQ